MIKPINYVTLFQCILIKSHQGIPNFDNWFVAADILKEYFVLQESKSRKMAITCFYASRFS